MDTSLLDPIFQRYSQNSKVPATNLEQFLNEAMKALNLPLFSSDQVTIFSKEVDSNHDGQLTKDNLYSSIDAVWRNCQPQSHSTGRGGGWVPPN